MIDIDHFKHVNDAHGHPVGDLVLAKTGEVLRMLSRGGDHAVRYGGEELAVLLPNTRVEHALVFAQRVREHIESSRVEYEPGKSLGITVSIGVATLTRDETSADLIRLADAALYQAKAGGRNQVRLSETPAFQRDDDAVSGACAGP
jgi:diguanylate cyclase (GGDEF)-like protein